MIGFTPSHEVLLLALLFLCPPLGSSCYAQTTDHPVSSPFIEFIDGPRALSMDIDEAGQITTPDHCQFGTCYLWVQFAKIPDVRTKKAMEAAGIVFHEYVRSYCYLISYPSSLDWTALDQWGIHSVEVPDHRTKLSARLSAAIQMNHAPGAAPKTVKMLLMDGVDRAHVASILQERGATSVRFPPDERWIFIDAPRPQLMALSSIPSVRFMDEMDTDGQPEYLEGSHRQRSNVLNNQLSGSGALRLSGEGVKVLLRDDGGVGAHIDFQGRVWNDPTISAGGSHGDRVGGVWTSAGNLDPLAAGAAPAADLYVIDYLASFLDDTEALHQDSGIVITNSAYSNGCNEYSVITFIVDRMAHDNPTLTHVFSAGNANGDDCGYGAGTQWGNITGGHKQGKNTIAVANLERDGSLRQSSSRGPAHDGRIKPDLATRGQDQISTMPGHQYATIGGTSGASANVSGGLTQLYQGYQERYGVTPEAALIKACAMNSAIDLGPVGPDYSYGWGLLHAGRAYDIISSGSFMEDTIIHQDTNRHTLIVPPGVDELRVMLYWNDPAASPVATLSLVNDLDLKMHTPIGGMLMPHVLDHTPDSLTLGLPASPLNGPDRLNNVEQIVIHQPSDGTYEIDVLGHAIPQGPQKYFIVYSMLYDEIKVTYPLGGERLVPGQLERIEWNVSGDSIGMLKVEYSLDSGQTWQVIADQLDADTPGVDWTPPPVHTSGGLIRVSSATMSGQSVEPFHLLPTPSYLYPRYHNQDSMLLIWEAIPDATSYDLYRLGERFMDSIMTTSTNAIYLPADSGQTYWYSVSADAGAIRGRRSLAIQYIHDDMINCTTPSALLDLPYESHFSIDLDDHCNPQGLDDFDWEQLDGETFTFNTGPTRGSTGTGYAYVEASRPNHPDKQTILVSACFDMSSADSAFMQFDYHMFGLSMGTLSLEVSTDQGTNWSASLWSVSGDHGLLWQTTDVDLTSYVGGTLMYRFNAITGPGFLGDIAVDNIRVDRGAICPRPVVSAWLDISDGTATTSILASADVDSVDWMFVRDDTSPFDAMPTHRSIVADTVVIADLLPCTPYTIYARSVCQEGSSAWVEGSIVYLPYENLGDSLSTAITIPQSSIYVDTFANDCAMQSQSLTDTAFGVYYLWQAGPGVDSVRISTCHPLTNFDTQVSLLDSTGSVLATNDDALDSCAQLGASTLVYPVTPSTDYFVVVEGVNDATGRYVLEITSIVSCTDSLLLNGQISAGLYTASSILSSGTVTDSSAVIYSAPSIELLTGFEVPLGASFETDTTGCD